MLQDLDPLKAFNAVALSLVFGCSLKTRTLGKIFLIPAVWNLGLHLRPLASEQCPVSLFVCGGEGPAPRPRFAYPFLPTPAPPSAGIGHAPDPNPRHEPANPVSLS